VPVYPNSVAVSGCLFMDVAAESFQNGIIFCEGAETVNGNTFINCSISGQFGSNPLALAQRASITCGLFDGNRFINSEGWLTAGPDSNGCGILAIGGNTNANVVETQAAYFAPSKPLWSLASGTSGPNLVYRTPTLQGKIVKLNSGTVNFGDLMAADLSNERLKQYPTTGVASGLPVHGFAARAETTAGNYVLMWFQAEGLTLNSTDATITGNDQWVKPSSTVAGEVTKAAGPWDSAIGFTTAGPASNKVNVKIRLGPSGSDPNAILQTLVDAKGDLLVGSADNTVIRKAVGTNTQVLTADSTAAGRRSSGRPPPAAPEAHPACSVTAPTALSCLTVRTP
jgi:hypothetical protein